MTRAAHLRIALAVALVSLVPACVAADRPATTTVHAPTVAPGSSPALPPLAYALPGSLLIREASGSLVTRRPDGSGRLTLAAAAPSLLEVFHAAWSPDGTHIAWSQLDQREGSDVARIVTATPRGGERVEAEVPLVPFYLAWDPTSRHVAFLGNQGDGLGFGVVRSATGSAATPIVLDEGAPYFFSWGPDGDRFLIHVGDDRLEELGLDGVRTSVEARPGVFQAPAWAANGRSQLYVRSHDRLRQTIVARRPANGRVRDLATIEGAASIVLSPDGRQVAYQALGPNEQDLYDRDLPGRLGVVGVTVLDVATGRRERISTELAAAWFWSPDASRLAVLEPVYDGDEPISFRWRIWDGEDGAVGRPFTASLSLLQETMPFFSQYAQSGTMWAPDGSAFAFPADLPGAPGTILVQPVDVSVPAYPVGRGTFVVWSPT